MHTEAHFLLQKFYAQFYVKFKIMTFKINKRVNLGLDKNNVLNCHDQGTSATKLALQFNCNKNMETTL